MLAMSLTGSSNGVEMDGICNAGARFSFVLHGAWNSLEMQWMMSCRIYELPLRWTGLHEVRCLVISTMRYAGISFLRQHGRGHRQEQCGTQD